MAHRSRANQRNNHHVWFEKPDYIRDRLLNTLRTHSGFIIPLRPIDHNYGRDSLHADERLRGGVPKPKRDAVEHFLGGVLLPYEVGKHQTFWLDQAIGWFAMTGNEDTAEHLALQREYITRTPGPYEIPSLEQALAAAGEAIELGRITNARLAQYREAA